MEIRPPWVNDLNVFACARCMWGVEKNKKYKGGGLVFVGISKSGGKEFHCNMMLMKCPVCKIEMPKYEFILDRETREVQEVIHHWIPMSLESMACWVDALELIRMPEYKLNDRGDFMFYDDIKYGRYNDQPNGPKKKKFRMLRRHQGVRRDLVK